MKLIVAVDNQNGMLFNGRRQSQDGVLRKHILEMVADAKLLMNSYSFGQFKNESATNIVVVDDPLANAKENEFCFIENTALATHADDIHWLILYRWNRDYPSDQKLDLDISTYKLVSSSNFAGSSHEKITEEIYGREG